MAFRKLSMDLIGQGNAVFDDPIMLLGSTISAPQDMGFMGKINANTFAGLVRDAQTSRFVLIDNYSHQMFDNDIDINHPSLVRATLDLNKIYVTNITHQEATGVIQVSNQLNLNGKRISNIAAPTVNTDAATKLYVDTKVTEAAGVTPQTVQSQIDASLTALVGGAPEALNTLTELAQALGEDANFVGTMTTELASKASKTELTNAITNFLTETEINQNIAFAVGDMATRTWVDTKVAPLASKFFVETGLADKATTSYVNTQIAQNIAPLANYATVTQDIVSAVAPKADISYVDSRFATLSGIREFLRVQVNAGEHTITNAETFIGCQPSAPITLWLPTAQPVGAELTIKDESGTSGTYPITIKTSQPLTEKIEGGSRVVLKMNRAALRIVWTGYEWSII